MIRKISGKNKSPSYTHLNMVGTDSKATSKTDIADPGVTLPPCRGLWGTLHIWGRY